MINASVENIHLHQLIRLISNGLPLPSNLNTEDIEHYVSIAKDHRMVPQIAKALNGDSALACRIHEENQINKLYQLQLVAELSAIKTFLKNTPFLVLKGNVLSQYIYDDPAERMSRDIDILIEKQKVEETIEIFKKEGYQLRTKFDTPKQRSSILKHFHHVELVHNEKQILVELHWSLTALQNIEINIADLFDKTIPIHLGSDEYSALRLFDLIGYLSIHGVFHGFFRLQWLIDIWTLKKKMSQNEHEDLIVYLKDEGILHFYLISLRLIEIVFENPMSDVLKEELQKNKYSMRIIEMAIKQINQNDSYEREVKRSGFNKMITDHQTQYYLGGLKGLTKSLISRNVRPKNWEIYAFPDSVFGLNTLFSRFIWLYGRIKKK